MTHEHDNPQHPSSIRVVSDIPAEIRRRARRNARYRRAANKRRKRKNLRKLDEWLDRASGWLRQWWGS